MNIIKSTLSVDHRVLDGAMASKLLQDFNDIIENPFERDENNGPPGTPNNTPDAVKPKIIPYGIGSGFFINKIHIVTNYHVIKGFEKLSIYAYNHPYVITDIEVVGYDQSVDIAVLQVNEENLPNDFF